MENDLLSVIVPVYNAEKYLPRCIESILASTYHNLELILIDDGSSDNSLLICDKYRMLDNRVQVFHKENGGMCSARNYGLDRCKGRYLAFVDNDDIVSPLMYEKLIEIITRENVLVSECSWIEVTESTGKEQPGRLKRFGRIPISKAQTGLLENSRAFGAGYVWNSVFDYKRICEQSNMKFYFDTDMDYFEDAFFQTSIFLQVTGDIFITKEAYYYYLIRDNSFSHKQKTMEDSLKIIADNYRIVCLIKEHSSYWYYRRVMGNHLNTKINLIYRNRNSNRADIWNLWNYKGYFFEGFQMSLFSWRFPAYYFKFFMIILARIKQSK